MIKQKYLDRLISLRFKLFGKWPKQIGGTDQRDLSRLNTGIIEAAHKFEAATADGNYTAMLSYLSELDYRLSVAFGELGALELRETLFTETLSFHESAFCANEDEAKRTVINYSKAGLKTLYRQCSDGRYVVYRCSDGKELPGVESLKPDIAGIIDAFSVREQPGATQVTQYLEEQFTITLKGVAERKEEAKKTKSSDEGFDLYIANINAIKDLKRLITKTFSNYLGQEVEETRLFERTHDYLNSMRLPENVRNEIFDFVGRLNGQMGLAFKDLTNFRIS